jgi:parallel beta-helix repeat protein
VDDQQLPSSRQVKGATTGVTSMTRARGSALVLSCLVVSLAAPSFLRAQNTIHVPGDVSTIQGGIEAASNGDTVLVTPGTYVENIDFKGKAITVTSSGGAATTTIDGGQNGVVVTFANNETRASVINGFTITDDAPPLPTQVSVRADGILVDGANPTITNNIVTNNRGYGIEVAYGSARISGNTVTNTATAGDPAFDFGCDYDDGDGIFIGGASNGILDPPIIDHNTIEQNVGHCEGGGIGLFAALPSTTISNNIIANNQSLGYGGGVYEVNGSVSLYQNVIYNNVSGVAGGGVYLSTPSEVDGATGPLNVFVTSNTIYGNVINLNRDVQDAWVDGSQVALAGYVSQLGFFNNLVIANDTYSAIACWPIYQYLSGTPPVVVNSDVINSGGPAYGGWCTSPNGIGDISADPKFKNPAGGDFHLLTGSPAIDTGLNAATGLLTSDLDGNPRIQNATGANFATVDMGAYEASGSPETRPPSLSTLAAQPGTIFYGQRVSLTTAVTNSSSSPVASGVVTFLDDWSLIQQSPLNSSGIAMVSSSSLGVGPHWLVASFGGNASYQPSISTMQEVVVNGFSTSTAISFSANPGKLGQSETLTATVALGSGNPAGTGVPTGNIAFVTSLQPNLLATVPLNASGVAVYSTSSLPAGTTYVQAMYQPTNGFLGSSSENFPLQIVAPPVATVTVGSNPESITTLQPLSATITVTGTTGNPTPTGTITLTSGSYSSGTTPLTNGTVTINIAVSSLTVGTDTLTAQYSGDPVYSKASGTGTVTVSLPIAISGTAVVVSPGAAVGNQSTITVTPAGGFAGNVALTAGVTSSPAGAANPPMLSFGSTGNINISSAAAGTATLTITTVAPVGCTQTANLASATPWLVLCDFAFVFVLFLVKPRRARWSRAILTVLLLTGLTSVIASCGGGSGGGACNNVQSSGTTAGSYVITVTGTSGSVTATGTVSLTVQ